MGRMEKTNRISLIALAIFSIVILLAHGNIEKAFALSVWTASASTPISMVYSTHFVRWVTMDTGGVVKTINPVSHVVDSITLPVSGTRTYQPTVACPSGKSYCIAVADGTGADDRVITFNPITGEVITDTTTGISGLTSVQNGGTVTTNGYIIGVCTVGSGRVARSVDGIQFGVCGGSTMGAQQVLWSTTGTTKTLFVNDGASGPQVWDNTALTLTCSVAVSVGAGGVSEYYNNNFYVVVSTTTINKYAESNCAAGTGISGTGLSTQMHGIKVNTGREEMYVLSTTTLAVMNLTSTNISTLLYSTTLGSDTSTNRANFDINTAGEQAGRIETTGTGNLVVAALNDNNSGQGGGTGGNRVCIEIVEGGSQVCYDDPDGNGIPNFPNGSFDAIGGGMNITRQADRFGCILFELTDCDNDDIKTDGTGVILLLLLMLITYICLVVTHVGAMKFLNKQNVQVMDYIRIDPMALLAFLILDVSIAKYLNWIPDDVFFIMAIAIAAFLTFGIYKHVRGSRG